jgi:hypothetical protein
MGSLHHNLYEENKKLKEKLEALEVILILNFENISGRD